MLYVVTAAPLRGQTRVLLPVDHRGDHHVRMRVRGQLLPKTLRIRD
jgi:hypothetical protein